MSYGVNMGGSYTIGTLAQEAGVNVETIRYYQRRGLVEEPARPPGGIRRYTQEHARRLRFVKEAQTLGFSLDEVGELLELEDGTHCREAERLGCRKLELVRVRIAHLRRVESALTTLIDQCHHNAAKVRCPLISALESRTEAPVEIGQKDGPGRHSGNAHRKSGRRGTL